MAPDQDWCLQCGAGAAGSLGPAGWRTPAAILATAAILVLAAAGVGYAALSKGTAKPTVVTTTVAQTITPAPSTPSTSSTSSTPATGAATPTPKAKASLPLLPVKPPKIPLTAVTPKASERTASTPASSPTKAGTPTSTTPTGTSTAGGEEAEPNPGSILLDTDAAKTYNPYELAASDFGDPSLAIDGDPSTAWTAQVDPTTAPSMAEGLLIDLKAKLKLSSLELITSTPGMTVQVYGTIGQAAPTSITDPAWVPLSAPAIVKKKHLRIKLRDSKKAFTFVTLWISKAPQSAIGSAQAPGHVDVNELELFQTSAAS
jgi:hypothetical protein